MVEGADESRRLQRGLRLDVRRYPDGLVLAITGELDIAEAGVMREVFEGLSQERLSHLIVDLTDLTFTDSTGLGVLIRAHKMVEPAGTKLTVVCPPGRIRRLFALTHLIKVLHVVDTLEEARAVQEEPATSTPVTAAPTSEVAT
ncbi:STAS domain-containing protein [Nocardioides sp. AN3]